MKKLVQLLAIGLFVSAVSMPAFAADTPSATDNTATTNTTSTNTATSTTSNTAKQKVMSMSSVLQQLQKAGYIVKSVDYDKDNNQYKVEAIDKHGDKQSLQVNASTGLSADQKKMVTTVPLVTIVKKYEKNGASVTSVSADGTNYKVSVVDNKGNEQDYNVDMQTGKASS